MIVAVPYVHAKGLFGAQPSVTAVLCVQGHFRIRKLGFERLVTGLPESGLPSTTLKCLPPSWLSGGAKTLW